MGVHRDHHLEPVSRMEVLAGPTDRRRWSHVKKDRIVAESLVSGVTVRPVAERYGLKPNHVSAWRGLARAGKLVVPDFVGASFAQVVVAAALPPQPPVQDRIELIVAGITLRLEESTDARRVAELAAALNAAVCSSRPTGCGSWWRPSRSTFAKAIMDWRLW